MTTCSLSSYWIRTDQMNKVQIMIWILIIWISGEKQPKELFNSFACTIFCEMFNRWLAACLFRSEDQRFEKIHFNATIFANQMRTKTRSDNTYSHSYVWTVLIWFLSILFIFFFWFENCNVYAHWKWNIYSPYRVCVRACVLFLIVFILLFVMKNHGIAIDIERKIKIKAKTKTKTLVEGEEVLWLISLHPPSMF